MKLCVLLLAICSISVDSAVVRVPKLGRTIGTELFSSWSNRTIHAFYGIRYAKSPSGHRRFMPPEPITSWGDVILDSTKPGIDCPQLMYEKLPKTMDDTIDLEDCLSLNVFTPKFTDGPVHNQTSKDRLLPVMVFIHGGSFVEGSAELFPPNYLLEKDILLVVLQYRLGPLGFLCLQTDGIAGNVGFMDQVLALEWVNQNIQYFGGDNNRVTLVGQSAGAAAISLFLLNPNVPNNLFQKAIMQSGSAFSKWIIDNEPLIYAKTLFKELSENNEDVDLETMEKIFKNSSVIDLQEAAYQIMLTSSDPFLAMGKAVVEEFGKAKFLSEHPSVLINKGRFRRVPLIAGITKDEGSNVVAYLYDILTLKSNYSPSLEDDYLRNHVLEDILRILEMKDDSHAFYNYLEDSLLHDIFETEELIKFRDVAPALIDVAGTIDMKSTTHTHAKMNFRYENTYLYSFDYRGQHTRFINGKDSSRYPFDGGIHHSNDLLYLFPYHYSEPLNKNDTEMAKIMVDLWTSFVIDDHPKSEYLKTDWKPLTKDGDGPYLHINSIKSYMDDDFVRNEYIRQDPPKNVANITFQSILILNMMAVCLLYLIL